MLIEFKDNTMHWIELPYEDTDKPKLILIEDFFTNMGARYSKVIEIKDDGTVYFLYDIKRIRDVVKIKDGEDKK
jgi:hypothetical protein